MSEIATKLKNFGLNQNEIAVYLAALKSAECSVGRIQSATGLHRQLIYNASKSLVEKQLLSVEKRAGRRRFVAADPENFEQIALDRLSQAQQLVKDLRRLKAKNSFSGESKLYKGSTEIQRYYMESVSQQPLGSRVDILGTESKRYFEILPRNSPAFIQLEQRRIERKIRWRLLLSGLEHDEARLNMERVMIEYRVLKDRTSAPIDLMLWNDHVGILVYGKDPSVLDIPGVAHSRGFRKYFDLLWKQGKEI